MKQTPTILLFYCLIFCGFHLKRENFSSQKHGIKGLTFPFETESPIFFPILSKRMESRRQDRYGFGHYGAPRDKGTRKHLGLDFIAEEGQVIYSPIAGELVRSIIPYSGWESFSGVEIQGTGYWRDYNVKLFYLKEYSVGKVMPGDPIGIAQDLTKKYPGITNHIHVEIRKKQRLTNPKKYFSQYLD